MVKVRFRGQIISGSKEYKFVGIQENLDAHGGLAGFNVLMYTTATFDHSFDDWVEDYTFLIEYLREKHWIIEWLPGEN